VLVVDDVITAGTAIRETMALLTPAGAHVVGLVLALDRQEKMSETSVMSAVQVCYSAAKRNDYHVFYLQSVTNEFGIPVFSVCGLRDLMAFISQSMTASPDSQAKVMYCSTGTLQYISVLMCAV
jgi:orotate phosphoribosyltransferase